jgi:DNA-binding NarL/FixJ family response regulator
MTVMVWCETVWMRELVSHELRQAGAAASPIAAPAEVQCWPEPGFIVLAHLSVPRDRLVTGVGIVLGHGGRVLLVADESAQDPLHGLFAGASGVVSLPSGSTEQLRTAIATVSRGEAALHASVAELLLAQWRSTRSVSSQAGGPAPVLTKREREVLQAVAEGLTSKQIARRLGLSVKTVENHRTRVFAKLQARTQAQAVSLALAQGLIDPVSTNPHHPQDP